MRNVHEFDRKLNIQFDFLYSEDEINEIICNARATFLSSMKRDAVFMATEILQEGNKKNIDAINNADARKLFIKLLDKIQQQSQEDIEMWQCLLEEQLVDMKNLGPCPQGRIIRLWQLFQSF